MLEKYKLSSDHSDGYLVWIEVDRDGRDGSSLSKGTLEVLSCVMDTNDGFRVWDIVFGHTELKPLYSEIYSHSVETLYTVHGKEYIQYDLDVYTEAISQVIVRTELTAVWFAVSEKGDDFACRVSCIINAGIVPDCSGILTSDRRLTVIGGSGIYIFSAFPQIITVAEEAYKVSAPRDDDRGTVIYWQVRRPGN